jgi:hypothetical protein
MIPIFVWALSSLWSFIKSPMNIVYSAAAIGVAVLYLQLQVANHRLDAMALEAANLRATVFVLEAKSEIQIKNDAIVAERLKAQEAATEVLNDVINEIDKSSPSSDGPVADVLRKELAR